ncbi:MAG: DNA primase, partial [Microbacterium sp.]
AEREPQRHAPQTAAPADGEAPVTRVRLTDLPRTADVAIERDALMGILQYGHLIDQEMLARAVAEQFRNPALDAVRESVASAADRTRVGWSTSAADAVREPYRSLAGELLMMPFPAKDEERALVSATDLCRRLILRTIDREKNELLGAVQRIPADSDGGRALRMRLRDIDLERMRFVES